MRYLAMGLCLCFIFGCAHTGPPAPVDAQDLYHRGEKKLLAGDLRGGCASFRLATEVDPIFFEAFLRLGEVQSDLGVYEESRASLQRAYALRSDSLRALAGLAKAAYRTRRLDEALALAESLWKASPDLETEDQVEKVRDSVRQRNDWIARGEALAEENASPQEAERCYREAISLDPFSIPGYQGLAVEQLKQGKKKQAQESFNRAFSLASVPGDSLAEIVALCIRTGNPETASYYLGRLKKTDTDHILVTLLEGPIRLGRSVPPSFLAIPDSGTVNRAELAALAAYGLILPQVRDKKPRVIITDILDHPDASAILQVAEAGMMEVYPNHTFQPMKAITRAEAVRLIHAYLVGRAVDWTPYFIRGGEIFFSDVPRSHRLYTAVALASATGVLPGFSDGVYRLAETLSGSDSVRMIDRLSKIQ